MQNFTISSPLHIYAYLPLGNLLHGDSSPFDRPLEPVRFASFIAVMETS